MVGRMQSKAMDAEPAQAASEAARVLLDAFRAAHPSWNGDRTPLDRLAAWMKFDVETFHPDDQPEGTYGFLDPGERLIWLRRDLQVQLRRFTLAHELGHAMLHRHADQDITTHEAICDDPCEEDDVREEVHGSVSHFSAEDLLGPGVTDGAYNPRSQRELAANIFAAELLMPLERVRALYLAGTIPPAHLADRFDVSQAAMLNRLAGIIMNALPPKDADSPVVEEHVPPPVQAGAREKKHYDAYQQAAIEAHTPALIVAGPGSGKTSTLIGRAEYLIHDKQVQAQHILALTFSRKAAQEMQERLQQALYTGNTHIPGGEPTVSTFHAFCAELLRMHGELVGLRPDFAFIDDAEGYFLLRRLGARLPLYHYQNLANPAASFPAILSAISRAKDELTTPAMYSQLAQQMLEKARETQGMPDEEEQERAEKALEVAETYALYQQQLERQGDTDFGGLIMLAVQLLEAHPGVREELQWRYQHILVDEFQDINRASGVLLRLLAGERRQVWVVGDANQAIYGFRGASPANIANFHQDYPGAVVLPLNRNYRSRPDIVNIADAFRRNQLEVETQSGTVESARSTLAEPYITLANAPDEASELRGIVEHIRHRHNQGNAYRDIVVLCRTRALARKVTRALGEADLPVIERGGMLEQEHIRGLLSVMLLLTDYGSMGILRAARQPDHPFSQADIEALLLALETRETDKQQHMQQTLKQMLIRGEAPLALSPEGRQSFARLSSIIKALLFDRSIASVWTLAARYLFMETSIGRTLLPAHSSTFSPENAAALRADYADLLALARYYDTQQQELRQQEAEQRGEAVAAPSMVEQVKGFLDYVSVLLTLRQDGGSRRESEGLEGEAPPDIIRVMTVHASKGLEFPVVYLPGIVNQRFPAQRRGHPAPPPRGMVNAGGDEAATHESGEACLFYVGATRARDQLIVSYADRYGKRASKPSSYIHALAAGLTDERVTRLVWPKHEQPIPVGTRFIASNAEDREQDDAGEISSSAQPGEAFIAARKPATLRTSDIETYQRCPRQYLYGSIYHFRGEPAAYQLFRRAAQQTLDDLQQQINAAKQVRMGDAGDLETRYPSPEEARALYTRHWQAAEGDTTPFAALYEQHGHEVAELLRRKLIEQETKETSGATGATGWQLSQAYTVDVAGQQIEVTVDRVESPAQANEPVAFVKTGYGRRKGAKGAVTPTARELLYTRAQRQHHPGQPIELRFHNMSSGETFEIKLTNKKEQSLYQELEKALAGLARGEFPPKPDMFVCPGCPYYLICPA